jgi:cytochrome c
MNSFEINKILGALLGTCLALLAVHIAAGAIFTAPVPAKPGYEIAVKESAPEQAQGKEATAEQPIEALLSTASVERGTQIAKQCQICHNLGKGQGPKVGPDLYDIVGRGRASQAGFNYSAAMKAKGGTWTVDDLNKFLTKPSAYIPGTLMTFAGVPRENQRADLIAFLNTLSDHPKPLPTAQGGQAAPAAAKAAPRRRRQSQARKLSRARNRIGSPNRRGPFGQARAVRSHCRDEAFAPAARGGEVRFVAASAGALAPRRKST